MQIGALCYRGKGKNLQVLLLTTRDTGRWILPKGWPILDKKSHHTALVEAYEEAGVIGKIVSKEPYASFASHKGHSDGLKVPTNVLVYLVEVVEQEDNFPEAGQREIRWLSVEDAIELTDEDGAKPILRQLLEEMREKGASA